MDIGSTSERGKRMRKLGFDYQFGGNLTAAQDDWQANANGYRVRFTYDRRKASFDYWQGSAIMRDPQAADVMSCLVSDAQLGQETFDDFCANLGYDTDSRRAERLWKACQSTDGQLRALFGADYSEALEHDWEGVNV